MMNELTLADNVIEEPIEEYKFDPANSGLVKFAKSELDAIGMTEDSPEEMNVMMRKHIIHMVTEFAKEGHSGFSANYAVSILKDLLMYKPLTPLTGEDSEWNEVSENLWQNKKCSAVFKDETDYAYTIDGRVFWEWYIDKETGEKHKSYFSNGFSRMPVKFPYRIPEKPIYTKWTCWWELKRNFYFWWSKLSGR